MAVSTKSPIHQKPIGLHRLARGFYFAVPHSLEQPESSRGSHNLNESQWVEAVLFLLYCYWCITKNLQACTDWTRFFTLGSLQSGAARRFQGMPQPQWAGTTRGWQAAVWQIYWDHLQGINVLLLLLCCYGCTTPNLHAPGTFKSTQTGQVFYFAVSPQLWEARKLQAMPQPKSIQT